MALMLQLNGNLPDRFPDHERQLYLFTCRRKPCRRKDGSIRGFRGTKITRKAGSGKAKEQESPRVADGTAKQSNLGATLFGVIPSSSGSTVGTNPFSTSTSTNQTNPFSSASSLAAKPPQKPAETDAANGLSETFADKVRLSSPTPPTQSNGPPGPWPAQSTFPRSFSTYRLDADYETLSEDAAAFPANAKMADMEVDGASSSAEGGGSKEDKDLFESSMDKTFQKFADRVSHNPEQVLRYEFGGEPLLYSSTDAVGQRFNSHGRPPPCQNCGSKRTFELQLAPHAIEMLEADEPASAALEGMDWGTVIMGVCEKDCGARNAKEGEVGYVEEWVGVQWEELSAGKK